MLGYLSADIICSEKLIVFLELRSRKTVSFSEQIIGSFRFEDEDEDEDEDEALCFRHNEIFNFFVFN